MFVAGGGKTPDALAKALKEAKAAEHGVARRRSSDVLADALERTASRSGPTRCRPSRPASATTPAGSARSSRCSRRRSGPAPASSADDVAPYLGEAGACRVYQLTNAIEEGDVAGALEMLHRLLTATGPQQPKPMHPLQMLAHAAQPRTAASPGSTIPRSATPTTPSPRSVGG